MLRVLAYLSCVALFVGCTPRPLNISHEFRTQCDLASSFVGTPDPRINQIEYLGEELFVSWWIPSKEYLSATWEVRAELVFRTGERQVASIDLSKPHGRACIPLLGESYFALGGYASYAFFLLKDSEVVACRTHPAYTNEVFIEAF
jgi:hypothetical protein